MLRKATIVSFEGSWGSGPASLILKDSDTGELKRVPCENGPIVSALASCYPDVLMSGHRINDKAFAGKEIFWRYDDMGLMLSGFVPVEVASGEVWEQYLSKADLAEQD